MHMRRLIQVSLNERDIEHSGGHGGAEPLGGGAFLRFL
jgi:hypothetical protein